MKDLTQIVCISVIIILMLFAGAIVVDIPSKQQFKQGLSLWCMAVSILIGLAIW